MEQNELRVGNIVNSIKYSYVGKIEYEQIKATPRAIIDAANLKPIELTEEWLIKAEFIIDEDKGYSSSDEECYTVYSLNGFNIAIIEGKFRVWIEIDGDNYYSFALTNPIEYIHTLQNVYHAFKGEELTFNL